MERKIIGYITMLLIITLLFFGVSVADHYVTAYQTNNMGETKNIIIFQFIVYSFAGMIFGFEKIMSEMKKSGHWKINLPRIIFIGLPSFLMGMIFVLYVFTSIRLQILTLSFVNSGLFISFMQMFFGYILVTSFYKSEEISSTKGSV